MTQKASIAPPSWTMLWALGTVLLSILYFLVFLATGTPPIIATTSAIANVLPLSVMAMLAHALLKTHVMPLSVVMQVLIHLMAAPFFAVGWYAMTSILLGFFNGLDHGDYTPEGFFGLAFVWQSFQGLILYALVAAVCYAIRGGRMTSDAEIVSRAVIPGGPALERYLVRDGEGMSPIAVDDIVTITGAQDYSEVATSGGRHLVRISLGEFEARLDTKIFLRVHRSTIINFKRLERAESAGGGRMLAHMDNGDAVQVSRAGAALLRSFVV